VRVKLLDTLPARLTAVQTYRPLSAGVSLVNINLDSETNNNILLENP